MASHITASPIMSSSSNISIRLRELGFKWYCLQLCNRAGIFDVEELVDPLHDNEEALWLTHVLDSRHKPRLLWRTMLQCNVIVIDREDLIFSAVDKKKASTTVLVKRPIFEKREAI